MTPPAWELSPGAGRPERADTPAASPCHPPGHFRRHIGNPRGITLLEVMVSLGIAAIVLVTVYRLQIQSIAMETAVQFHTVAPLLADQVMARAELQIADLPARDNGRFEGDLEEYSWELSTRDVGNWTTPTGQPLLKQIDVRISRHDQKDQFSLRTYRLAVPAP